MSYDKCVRKTKCSAYTPKEHGGSGEPPFCDILPMEAICSLFALHETQPDEATK